MITAFQSLLFPASTFILVVISFLVVFHHKRKGPLTKNKKMKLAPSPMKLPIIGNLHQLGPLPHRALQSLSSKYGPLMLLHFGSFPFLIVSSAEAACEILKHQDLIFSNRPKFGIQKVSKNGLYDLVLAPYGEYWRQMKSICVLHLLSNKKVQSFRKIREEETSNMIEKIRKMGASTVNLSEMILSVTNDVICRTVLGRKYGEDDEQGRRFMKLISELVEIAGAVNLEDLIPWLGWTNRINGFNSRVEKVAKGLDGFLNKFLRDGRDKKTISSSGSEEASNFIDTLLDYQKDNNAPVEDDAIKAIILDVFTAGMHTTAVALEWAMTELLKNPTTFKAIQDEVRSIIIDRDNKEITEKDLDQMLYLKAVIKETLRLHPPDPLLIPRESMEDTKVMGYDILARTRVIINAWAISNDPSIWDSPQYFRPERFLTETASNIDFKGLHFELIPFGSGRRGCPGFTFAVSVAELVIAKLASHFTFMLPNGDLDMGEASGLTVHKKTPLLVTVNPWS